MSLSGRRITQRLMTLNGRQRQLRTPLDQNWKALVALLYSLWLQLVQKSFPSSDNERSARRAHNAQDECCSTSAENG
jgi:hypothetical protein